MVAFLSGEPARPSQYLLAGGTGDERRVASVQLISFFQTASEQCSFDIQATAQFAHPPGKG